MMSPRALFGVAIRVIGIWFFTQAAYWFFWAAVKSHAPSLGNPNIPISEDMASGSFYLVIAAVLLFLADPLSWKIYGTPTVSGASEQTQQLNETRQT